MTDLTSVFVLVLSLVPFVVLQSQLGDCYASGLDEMLESVLDFFDVVQGVPVIFSILILALSHRRPSEPLPSTVGKLYAAAIEAVFRSRSEISDVNHAAEMYDRASSGKQGRLFIMAPRALATHRARTRQWWSLLLGGALFFL